MIRHNLEGKIEEWNLEKGLYHYVNLNEKNPVPKTVKIEFIERVKGGRVEDKILINGEGKFRLSFNEYKYIENNKNCFFYLEELKYISGYKYPEWVNSNVIITNDIEKMQKTFNELLDKKIFELRDTKIELEDKIENINNEIDRIKNLRMDVI